MTDLTARLRDWAARREAEYTPPVDEVVAATLPRLQPPATPHPYARQVRYLRLALAASLALLLTATVLLWPERAAPPLASQPTQPGISAAELAELGTAVREMQRVFPEGIRWLAKIDGQMVVKAGAPQRIGGAASDRALLVRYQVLHQRPDQSWQIASTHDLITYADEPVGSPEDDSLYLWCHLASPTLALIESDLTVDGLAVHHVGPQALSTTHVVLDRRAGGRRVRVMQTITGI